MLYMSACNSLGYCMQIFFAGRPSEIKLSLKSSDDYFRMPILKLVEYILYCRVFVNLKSIKRVFIKNFSTEK